MQGHRTVLLVGECYVFLHDLLKMKSINGISGTNRILKKVMLEKVLWHDGRNIGEISGEIEVEYEPFIQQLFAGVMTELGLKKTAPLVVGNGKRADRSAEYVQLADHLNKLNQLNANYRSHAFSSENHELDYESFKIKDTADMIRKILEKSEKKSSISFIYTSIEQLLEIQGLFLDIAEALWLKFDSMQGEMETAYCQCFQAFLKRGELDLTSVGIDNDVPSNLVDAKVHIAARFHRLMIEVLGYVFDQLENRAISNSKRSFIEFYLSWCYFRIPDFRAALLQVLSEEQTGPAYETDNSVIRTVLFSWKEDFFDQLQRLFPRFQQQQVGLTNALKKNWRNKFRSRGIIFFFFVKEWCEYVRKSIVVNSIDWEQIPGYSVIVQNFLSQLRTRPTSKYPDILIESSVSLLANSKLLKPFFYAVLEKTK